MSMRLRWLAPLALCALVVTCGQKGPLRLPDEEPEARAPGVNCPADAR